MGFIRQEQADQVFSDIVRDFLSTLNLPTPFLFEKVNEEINIVWPDYILQMTVCADDNIICTKRVNDESRVAIIHMHNQQEIISFLQDIQFQ